MGLFRREKKEDLGRSRSSPVESVMTPYSNYNSKYRQKKEVNRQTQKAPDINLALNKIGDKISDTKFILNKVLSKGDLKPLGDSQSRNNNDIMKYITTPNADYDFSTLLRLASKYYRTNGEYLILLARNSSDLMNTSAKIRQIYVLNPAWIIQRPKKDTNYYLIDINYENPQYIHEDNIVSYGNRDIENPNCEYFGDIQSMSDELSISEKSSGQINSYFVNDSTPKMIISAEGMPEPKPDRENRLESRWKEKFLGFTKKYMPFFTGSKITVTKLQSEWKDMELKELRKEEKELLRRYFSYVVDLDNSNRSTAQVVVETFYNDQVIPRLKEICRIYNFYILPKLSKEKLQLTFIDPTPADKEMQEKILEKYPNFATKKRLSEWTKLPLEEWEDESEILIPNSMVRVSLKNETVTDAEGKQYKLHKKDIQKLTVNKQENDNQLFIKLNTIIESEYNSEEVYDDVIGDYVNLIKTEGNNELSQLGVEPFFNIKNPEVVAYLEDNVGQNIVFISDTYKNFLRKGISEGIDQGLGINGIIELMKQRNVKSYTTEVNENSLRRIARTETHDAFQETKLQSYKQSEVVPFKQWLTAKDERVREWHSAIDSEIIAINDYYTSGLGNTAQRPGGFGVAQEDIHCRCTSIPKFDKVKQSDYEFVKNVALDEMEDTLALYENSFTDTYENALDKQFNKIINRMEVI